MKMEHFKRGLWVDLSEKMHFFHISRKSMEVLIFRGLLRLEH